jgi:hypothetical protein
LIQNIQFAYSKKGKARASEKILLPLQDSLINKAKACEEVILYERGDLRNSQSSQSVRDNVNGQIQLSNQKLP